MTPAIPPTGPSGRALFGLAFRPFFFGAAVFAVLAVALWAAAYLGWLGGFAPRGGWLAWHLREMPFGFAVAVIAGFLLTAVRTWTGSPGLAGRPLAALFALWLAARIGWLWPAAPWPALAAVELLFVPLVAARLGWQLARAGQRRNYPLVGLLALLTAADAASVYALAQGDFGLLRQAAWAALWLIGTVIAVIGGRVIPLFTASGLGRPAPPPAPAWLQHAAVGGLLALAAAAAGGVGLSPDPRLAPLLAVLALLHGLRLARGWQPGAWRVPLVWSLHVGYGWLVLALAGLATWHAGLPLPGSAALHALAVGCIGGLILAMMARVSLGHTGRPLVASPAMALAFGAMTLAAITRVALAGSQPRLAVALAAGFWCLAFGLFVCCHGPMLWRPRPDGRPG
ncbi:NnrS family protein [Immundisolibacter sp.]|uniref:NnrS family protein n=1 Tax=Immundisolibacter sp. TaxID=1934948 RepID=UPI003F82646B